MHTSFPKGTPLYIIMRSGEVITGKFADKKSGKVLLEDGQRLNLEDVRMMTVRKLKTSAEGDIAPNKIKWRKDS